MLTTRGKSNKVTQNIYDKYSRSLLKDFKEELTIERRNGLFNPETISWHYFADFFIP